MSTPPGQPEPGGQTRVGRTIIGALLVLVSVALLVGGAALVVIHTTQRDDDGFYKTDPETLTTVTRALVSDHLDVGTDGPDWLFRKGRLGTIRVTATGSAARPVFLGIAPSKQVEDYLRGVAYDKVTDVDVDPFTVSYERSPGSRRPAAPAGQRIWARDASGAGKQTLTWPVEEGSWDVVIMNADGTRGVRTAVTVGAKVPGLIWLGVGLLVAGGLLALLGAALIISGTRRRPPQSPVPGDVAPGGAGGPS